MKKRNLSILITCLFFFTCKKDSDIFIPYDNPTPEITYVMGSVGGAVIDEGANPIANASIKLFTKTTSQELMTDENGIFLFRNVEINAERTYLQIESEGFFPSSRNFTPRTNGTEFLKIQLMSATSSGSYLATEGGLVDVMGGGTVELPADAVVDASGNVYNENVQVSARYINGLSTQLGEKMPGNMVAINSEGETKILASYGMIALGLATDSGEPLQIGADKLATIRVPVADTLNALTTIPLWYFDEAMGLWIEEGQGQLVGGHYESTVSQVAFWSWGVPHDLVNLKATISIEENDTPFENVYTKLTVVGSGVCAFGYTDDGGVIDGAVAATQLLHLQIYDNCFNLIYDAEIGPFPGDTNLSNIPVGLVNGSLVELNGSLNCDDEPVANGYVKLVNGENERFVFTDSLGNFSNVFSLCQADGFDLTGVDMTSAQQSVAVFHVGEELVEVSAINVCE